MKPQQNESKPNQTKPNLTKPKPNPGRARA